MDTTSNFTTSSHLLCPRTGSYDPLDKAYQEKQAVVSSLQGKNSECKQRETNPGCNLQGTASVQKCDIKTL